MVLNNEENVIFVRFEVVLDNIYFKDDGWLCNVEGVTHSTENKS